MKNFWASQRRPIYALAPMAGAADSAFRQICKSFGADLSYSEMASATALCYSPQKTLELIKFKEVERPYVVQLFGSDPDHFAKAAKIVEQKVKPDGIDINFGCPVPKVAKQKAGAELMKDLKNSRQVIKTVINNTKLPVSIKIRAKAGKVDALDFLKNIEDLDVKALMVHGRTLTQGFSGEINFETIKNARNFFKGIILANGGINSYQDAEEILRRTKADGIGIARGALGRPWIFQEIKTKKQTSMKIEEIFKIALKQAKLAKKEKGSQGIIEMRKHLCWYVQGLSGAKELRKKFIKVKKIEDIKKEIVL